MAVDKVCCTDVRYVRVTFRRDSLLLYYSSEVYHIRGISVGSLYPGSILTFIKAL